MKAKALFGFALLLAIDTGHQVCIKLAGDHVGAFVLDALWFDRVLREPLVYVVLGLYAAAFVVYSWLLRVAPVGPSYAALHGHVVTVLLISLLFFGERLTLMQLAGCALIIGGIALLAVTERLSTVTAAAIPMEAEAGAPRRC